MTKEQTNLNAICPYFTMFPLDFPHRILKGKAKANHRVLDPFCGRGTTNFAARLLGLDSQGVDASPIAVAITASKLANTTCSEIISEYHGILSEYKEVESPQGEFWKWAFHPEVLNQICYLRQALIDDCSSPARIALRGIILGALHGPRQKTYQSYFSNQCPRTYAPKPGYAVRFWQRANLHPERVDITDIICRRTNRYFQHNYQASGVAFLGDSRTILFEETVKENGKFDWVITSPPYYGMRTYIPDQWLRNWFLGGPDIVDYSNINQIGHSTPASFAADLRKVWMNIRGASNSDANLVIRFGGITDRKADPREIIKNSLAESGWRIKTIKAAGTANEGKRQANSFLTKRSNPVIEYDIWAASA
ncbi:DNA methyltransferase [Gluconacetobacter diazotrophicus]|uniref:DNA methyltransferase n=1 Tax=Gluconacetobacter diazotrophicus TaxID=33996 RepID=UPI001198D272|nr:DNA methyltransferase [Gluconacetobacter diazotrophicus]TWB03492.1 DNA methylase [Gluconacetobacter diazotrophicus]